ncbi:MAG: hypothetical protein K2L57_03065, partial [Muribaculaceae bacterium]|nr:hypothetical protein [Muribaculaceae bacterium]
DKPMALKYFNQAAASGYADSELLAQFLVQEGVRLPVKKNVATVGKNKKTSAKKSAKSASSKRSGKTKSRR